MRAAHIYLLVLSALAVLAVVKAAADLEAAGVEEHQLTLEDVDETPVQQEQSDVREPRQFGRGFGRGFGGGFGGGYGRRPYFGGGGGGFRQPYYGGYGFRRPYYGGFYPRPYYPPPPFYGFYG